jgi:Cell Wall Hydrolase
MSRLVHDRQARYGVKALNRRGNSLRVFMAIAGWLLVSALAACAPAAGSPVPTRVRVAGISDADLKFIATDMDPAMRALAIRHDPGLLAPDLWNRPPGWDRYDLTDVPDLGFNNADGASAQEVNALRPYSRLPIRPMRPFALSGEGEDRRRALQCLSQAVYYEAAREPALGQEAVAQVVLNRLRHPAYPKSVCAVVYQGAARTTGCQFTFTCDGSLKWAPQADLWRQAQAVAKRALDGHVAKAVGSATHYHADYVAPYWAPSLVKMTKVGAHIFYRWTGPWGEPQAFTGRYAGREAILTPEILGGVDPHFPEPDPGPELATVTLTVGGEVRTYTVADPKSAGGAHTPTPGTLTASRRLPTFEEVRAINEKLAALERDLDAPTTASPTIKLRVIPRDD